MRLGFLDKTIVGREEPITASRFGTGDMKCIHRLHAYRLKIFCAGPNGIIDKYPLYGTICPWENLPRPINEPALAYLKVQYR